MRLHLLRLSGFVFGAIGGLLAYIVIVSVLSGTPLLFGESLLMLVYGFATLMLGAIPLYFVGIVVFRSLRIQPTLGASSAIGLVLGLLLYPSGPVLGSYLKDLPFWRQFDGPSQVAIGMGAVALFCTIFSALLVALVVMSTSLLRGQKQREH